MANKPEWQKECTKTKGDACLKLAVFYQESNNQKEAIHVYREACNGKNYEACFYLGIFQSDEQERNRLYKLACEEGKVKQACDSLAGDPHKQERIESKKKCAEGDLKKCTEVGVLLEKEGNLAEAKAAYKKSCQGKDLQACLFAAGLAKKQGNLEEAKTFYQSACNLSEPNCFNLELLELYQQKLKNLGPWQSACAKTKGEECLRLANLLEESGEKKEAVIVYRQACEAKNYEACWYLGFSDPKNKDEDSEKLYRKACEEGKFAPACQTLEELREKMKKKKKSK